MRSWDYVIVGAGTSGSLIAKRIAVQMPTKRILLLEAGNKTPWWARIPVGYLRSIGNAEVDWRFETAPEKGLNGRRLRYPRGRTLGGCSAINGMIYMRGQSADYDHWAELLNDSSWMWKENVLPLFKRFEDHHRGASEFHGSGGEWTVSKQRLKWDVLDEFERAVIRSGLAPATSDFNTGNNYGVGAFEVNQRAGYRLTTGEAFLEEIPQNLTIETATSVARVDFEGRRAVGVTLVDGSQRKCAAEIILAAGAIGSPNILEWSGVGNRSVIESLGVPLVHENEHIGRESSRSSPDAPCLSGEQCSDAQF